MLGAAEGLFEACIAAIPYAPASAFLASEQAKLAAIPDSVTQRTATATASARPLRAREDGERPRVAILADGIGSMHGVTRTIEEIRQRGVPGFEVEVVGTDPEVDRRLPAVAEIDVPFYPGLRIGVPSLPAAVQSIAGPDGARYDAIHVCSPGPAGIAGALIARAMDVPLVGSYHTELTAYAELRSGERRVGEAMAMAVSAFYGACDIVLSPSPAADDALAAIGMAPERVLRWDRGVDTERFRPRACAASRRCPMRSTSCTRGASRARRASSCSPTPSWRRTRAIRRLHLVLAGGGPEQERLRERLGERASFLGWLEGEELARAYASADMFLFPSATDTFGQVILEAQASGLPVIALAHGGPLSLIEHGVSGLLCEPDARRLADARARARGRAAAARAPRQRGAARRARGAPGSAPLERLADGYRRALADPLQLADALTTDRPRPRVSARGGQPRGLRTRTVARPHRPPATLAERPSSPQHRRSPSPCTGSSRRRSSAVR